MGKIRSHFLIQTSDFQLFILNYAYIVTAFNLFCESIVMATYINTNHSPSTLAFD